MRVWVDDNRQPIGDWTWAKTYEEALDLFESARVEEISLDHDLGLLWDPADDDMRVLPAIELQDELSGYNILLWMVSKDYWPEALSVHSMNSVRAEQMRGVIERYGPYVYKQYLFYDYCNNGQVAAVRYTKT